MNIDILNLESDIRLHAGEHLVFDLASGGHWYGHGFNHVQAYPLETGQIENDAFAVNNIQCPVWMCSAGLVLFADTMAPLRVSINSRGDGQLRVSCPDEPFTVRVFRGITLTEAHGKWLRHIGWPNCPPDASLFGDSLFCTWTQYPRCISQKRVLDMARQIRDRGYPCRTLLIDDRWENCFGDLEFSETDFPDPREMFSELREMGFDAWLWVTPFVNVEATCFAALARERVLVSNKSGNNAALLKWWGGTAGLVDLTAPHGCDWYRSKLKNLMDIGAAGFKIDGGDRKYQPPSADCVWHVDPGASGYSDRLLSFFDDLVPNRCETRTAWLSQKRPIIWREGGKDSHWGADNGLKAMVTLGLHLSLLGYDLLIPDMVPGRVQTMNAEDPLPTDELMTRWIEASAFFPFLQFSYFPWNYARDTADAALGYARVHKVLEAYMKIQAENRRSPLLRPLWYEWPEHQYLYTVSDEFMLGADLLAAPVLDEGVTRRDVLLPPGNWIDVWTGREVSGALCAWPAPCPGIPLFVHSRNPILMDVLRPVVKTIRKGTVSTGITTSAWNSGLTRDITVSG
ncbi:MAG: hypothetical protein JW808_01085 [Victivallales bacterium]|nr:hypothetical protein [Victivallales bacterium]